MMSETRVIEWPVKCSRCRLLHSQKDRVSKQRRDSVFDKVCPACGAKTFYKLDSEGLELSGLRPGRTHAERLEVTKDGKVVKQKGDADDE